MATTTDLATKADLADLRTALRRRQVLTLVAMTAMAGAWVALLKVFP